VRSQRLLCAAIALGAAACSDCRSRADVADAAPSAGPRASVELKPALPPAAPSWRTQEDPRGFGLPAGCTLELPIHHAALPGAARFSAARSELDELAIAIAAPGQASVESGVIARANPRVRALPWFELDRPPAFDRTKAGWAAAFARPGEHGKSTAVLWSEQKPLRALASGDQLAVADIACQGERCAILTTLPRAAAAPGAALHLVDANGGVTSTDLEADPGVSWGPLAITFFDGSTARVALRAPDAVAIWSVAGGRAMIEHETKTAFGTYDAVSQRRTLIVAPGARVDQPCKEDRFPIRIHAGTEPARELFAQAAPESLMLRPLEHGALILWVAPVSCSNAGRTIVYGALIGDDGAPLGSATAIADAVGFAAATRGNELALWLRSSEGLTLLRARCTAVEPPSGASPPSPSQAPPEPRSKAR